MITILRQARIPRWWLAKYAADIPRAYDLFRELLAAAPLSLSDLARDIRVDQSTVSRWAVGRTQPTPEQMKALIVALQSRIMRIGTAAERASRTTNAVEAVTQAFEKHLARSGTAPQQIRVAAEALHATLKEVERGRPVTTQRARRKRGDG